MGDPRLALRLYVLILIVALMFSKRWGPIRAYFTDAYNAGKAKSSGQNPV